MGVVVEKLDAFLFSYEFDSALDSSEKLESALDGIGRDAVFDSGGGRAKGIAYVVKSGYVEIDTDKRLSAVYYIK